MRLADLRNIVKELKRHNIKPYKNFYGLGIAGLFQIEDEAQFQKLRKNTNDRATRRQLS